MPFAVELLQLTVLQMRHEAHRLLVEVKVKLPCPADAERHQYMALEHRIISLVPCIVHWNCPPAQGGRTGMSHSMMRVITVCPAIGRHVLSAMLNMQG